MHSLIVKNRAEKLVKWKKARGQNKNDNNSQVNNDEC